jgi:hypothetical protein
MSNRPRPFSFEEGGAANVLFGSKRRSGSAIDPKDVVLAPYEALVLRRERASTSAR